jgi:hypothetical protein
VSQDLYVSFADPAETIDLEEFDRFEDRQVTENLAIPRLSSCRRYSFRNMRGDEYPARYRFISIYEVDGTADALVEVLQGRSIPEGPGDVTQSAQVFTWLEGDLRLTDRDQLIFVFTSPPPGMTFERYDEWYPEHIQQNIRSSDHIEAGWRYGLTGGRERGDEVPTHCAIYALKGSAEEMLLDVNRAIASGATGMLQGFHVFASFEATALAPRRLGD